MGSRAFWFETIPYPGLGHYVGRRSGIGIDLIAELADKQTQVLRLLGAACAPDRGKQRAMRSHFVRITGKIDEQLKFLWRQLQFAATDGNRVRVQVNAEITIFDHSSTTFFLRSTS